MELVPYSFQGLPNYSPPQRMATSPGYAQGVYITLLPDAVDNVSAMFERWFADREEVVIVDTGVSDKQGLGFILLEWMECEVDQLFLAILQDEEVVGDYTVYGRILEE